jgi:PAS domain S-box-containing protein
MVRDPGPSLPPQPELAEDLTSRSMLDALPQHVAILDADGMILLTNRAWRQFTRANSSTTTNVSEGANYLAACATAVGDGADEAAAMAAGLRAVARGEQPDFVLEYACDSPREKRWFSARATRFLQDRTVHLVVTHENITYRKHAERIHAEMMRELEMKEARLSTLVQTIPDLVWLKSVDGVFFWCNPVFERLVGVKEKDVIGCTDYDFLDDELADFVRENDRKAMAADRPVVNEEWLTFADDGHRALFETIKTPMRDPDGEVIGVLGIARDITERHLAEQLQILMWKELATKEAFLRTLLQTVPELVWLKDVDGVYVFCNSMNESLLGRKEADIVGKTDYELFDREVADIFAAIDRKVMAAEEPSVDEIWLTFAADGRRALYESIKTPMRDADGQILGVLGIGHDITERHQAAETLRAALAELARSNEELAQFAYVASHDLQEPLRMVSSYTQLLAKRYTGRLDADADEFIAYAVDGANRMQRLITDLLAYSRVGTRGKKLEPTDFAAALASALVNLKAAIDESGAVVTHDPLPILRADRSQIAQLFQNLIANAVKFHGAEPPRVHVSAAANDPEGKEWLFSVRDNGIGIEPQYSERIFAVFHRLHTREEYPGTGIGLAICKKTVERHGGRIWVESALGEGTTFRFTIATGDDEP